MLVSLKRASAAPLLLASAVAAGDPAGNGRVDASESTDASGGADVAIGFDGVEISTADDDFSMSIGGRLHADSAHQGSVEAVGEADDGASVRRARIELGGTLDADWSWAAEADFAGNRTSLKDFRLGFSGWDALTLTAGHQKQPFSLALEMSSNDIPFVERGVDTALVLPFADRAVGARTDAHAERWFVAAGVFGGDARDGGEQGWGTSARLVYAPVIDERRVLHIGFRGAYREPDGPLRFHAGPNSESDLRLLDTGALGSVRSATLLGPEVAAAAGSVSVTAEYNRARLERALADLTFDSWHVAAAWSPGGAPRAARYRIDSGEFKRLPLRGSRGAWELAARYASLDLTDGAVRGGEEQALSLGANWYANPAVRLMADFTRVLDAEGTDAALAADGLDTLTLRVQVVF